ncbi:response regulator transcription factor [Georgenia wutianyii]|nr:helix-turn-helix transcriptional regulator [Georgenia wutianyii]
MDQHLWIPVPSEGRMLQVCGACRAADRFTGDEHGDAVAVQRLLVGVVKHSQAVHSWRGTPGGLSDHRLATAAEWHLTAREVLVLDLGSRGMTSAAIARALSISPRTVEKHFENTYRKLGTRDRISAVLRAQSSGVLTARRTN